MVVLYSGRTILVIQDLQDRREQLALQDLLVQLARKDLLALPVQPAHKVLKDQLDLLALVVQPVSLAQLGRQDHRDQSVSLVQLDLPALKDQ